MGFILFLILPAVLIFNLAFGVGLHTTVELPEPVIVKGIYMTGYTAASKARRENLFGLIDSTELNAVVIDIKDYTGKILYDSKIPIVNRLGSKFVLIRDLPDLLDELDKRNIYAIARIAVFQDPFLAQVKPEWAVQTKSGGVWRDYKGLSWVDPGNQEVWDYNIAIAKEAVDLGFKEINFDYIRYPSDGNLQTIQYPYQDGHELDKNEVIGNFFEYTSNKMKSRPAYLSADLFGMTLWRDDGLNIGQTIEAAAPHFDYISPMVYPSHYPDGFEGFANPAEHPYEIVYRSLVRASLDGQRAKIRPWLQDFDLGAVYNQDKLLAQIQATYDSGWESWYFWSAANTYTTSAFKRD
ncbi:MAG: GTP-binding protein [Candidatus Buchananbacteria bacterium CG10_big_fil_rev_8_21_14_0_10_42_9]|uniref:GTP-binding protein n=1 Tax=Candidatus Buchananbacteria bacterium CG10_big_fil_rev_8_21_14_0_10_42_9 TaxID=1974526 RepID=A0A2H0W278_9BACT|nr:MAG: GTP-binding protein [Candidatus Buchananbacteria bacterium CG10_big_fil_rev_8_21_14_0_10_42_9]